MNTNIILLIQRAISLMQELIIKLREPMILPIPQEYWNKVTQPFGVPNDWYQSGVHNGTDFACPFGTPLTAPCDGEIIHRYTNHPTMGKCVYFATGTHYMRFMHLSEAMVQGKYKQGQLIGKTGNSGLSTGSHLHLDLWNVPINTALIKTKAGVHRYMLDPIIFFKKMV